MKVNYLMMGVLGLNVLICNAESVAPVLLTNELCQVEIQPETGRCLGYAVHASGFDFRLAPGTELLRDVFSRKAMEGEHKVMKFQSQLKSAEQGGQLELTANFRLLDSGGE